MKGKIYKIEFNDNLYIGSTIMKYLSQRQQAHNKDYKIGKKFKLYEECKKHNIEKIKCILLEEVDINDKLELSIIEQRYIEELKPNLNMVSAHLSLIENRRKCNIRQKKYYEDHRDKILEKKKNKKI